MRASSCSNAGNGGIIADEGKVDLRILLHIVASTFGSLFPALKISLVY